jgi:predicted nucleotidyltransferase
MALNWNVSNVDYYKDDLDSIWIKVNDGWGDYDDVIPELKSMIFSTMAIGIGHLSEKTAPDFYARFKVLEKIDDFYVTSKLCDDGLLDKQYITPYIVKKHIGLSTNVTTLSNIEWVKNLLRNDKRIKYSNAEIKSMITVYSIEYRESFED